MFVCIFLILPWCALRAQTIPIDESDTCAIARLLQVYNVYDINGLLELRRIGKANDGGYVICELAMQKADVIFGYGISDDISFETDAAEIYQKPSYGFDGTCPPIKSRNSLCRFIHQCIISQASTQTQKFSRKKNLFSSYEQQMNRLGVRGKKIFVKMDIEGNEYDTLPDILRAGNATGIVLEIHFCEDNLIPRALSLLKMLAQDFLLVHVHGNNHADTFFTTQNSVGYIPRVLELSYINKNLVDRYELSPNQTHPASIDMPNDPGLTDTTFTILNAPPVAIPAL